ncbi:hypothetical protein Ddye_025784 [Dipteronia dyeriana]|uniref:Myb/SANT-like domain-containing protein n=1 Tax=Dipteronia dyeriana TaxID=168575 RepID=A0AAD9TKW4_9ROSI|nr:hypothetical protein Ddye_025784 [Dipteronia dyeriana]
MDGMDQEDTILFLIAQVLHLQRLYLLTMGLVMHYVMEYHYNTFAMLCELLRNTGRLKTEGLVSVEEQVCIFLHILAHYVKNRTIRNRFYRSGETISRYFNSVLSAVLQLHNSLLVSPDHVSENCTDERWKRFKRYVVHICVPGWEGSASDSRVLRDALSRPTGLKVPTGMDARGCTQINEQERRGNRRVWVKEEEETLLATILPNCSLRATTHIESKLKTRKKQYGVIYDMINTSGFGWNSVRKCVEVDSNEAWHSYVQHHKQAEGWRDNPFPLYERLANIFGKDHATGKTTYTSESLAADLEEDDNFDNEFEMPAGNFSPMSINQTDSNQQMNQASSQPVSRKRSRSGDPIVRSMDRFTNVMNDAIDKTTDTLDKMCQLLAKSKMNENRVIADDLQTNATSSLRPNTCNAKVYAETGNCRNI